MPGPGRELQPATKLKFTNTGRPGADRLSGPLHRQRGHAARRRKAGGRAFLAEGRGNETASIWKDGSRHQGQVRGNDNGQGPHKRTRLPRTKESCPACRTNQGESLHRRRKGLNRSKPRRTGARTAATGSGPPPDDQTAPAPRTSRSPRRFPSAAGRAKRQREIAAASGTRLRSSKGGRGKARPAPSGISFSRGIKWAENTKTQDQGRDRLLEGGKGPGGRGTQRPSSRTGKRRRWHSAQPQAEGRRAIEGHQGKRNAFHANPVRRRIKRESLEGGQLARLARLHGTSTASRGGFRGGAGAAPKPPVLHAKPTVIIDSGGGYAGLGSQTRPTSGHRRIGGEGSERKRTTSSRRRCFRRTATTELASPASRARSTPTAKKVKKGRQPTLAVS